MNKFFTIIVVLLTLIGATQVSAQVFRKVKPIICPADPVSYDTYVAPPELFLKKKSSNAREEQAGGSVDIIVTYNGFTAEAQSAFQYAVDIWESLIDSPVPIYVNANFSDLGSGVLGSAGPTSIVRSFDGAPVANIFYPLPLAEKLAGKTLNNDGEADLNANFSSTFGFYFGTDGNPPAGQHDFVTIVLHELGHGLGFTGIASYDDDTDEGSWDVGTTGSPSIYTKYVEQGDGSLITDLPTSGTDVGSAFTSDDLFFNALLSVTELGERPRLYAPSTWNSGSSYSHLDEATYPAGNENSLMSPQVGSGEAIHDLGITLDMFADMGWVHTYLTHVNSNKLTNNMITPFTVELEVTSDTSINTLLPVVTYTYSDFTNSVDVALVDSGDGITFSADIPNPGMAGTIKYYFSGVQDGLGRDYSSPGSAPANFHQINIINSVNRTVPYLITDGGSFEVNQSDFQAISLSSSEVNWELGTPTNRLDQTVSGTNVWKTKLDQDVARPTLITASALVSPYFDLSDDTKNHTLSFNYSMENAFTDANGLFETGPYGFHVQYSIDGGQNWELLGEKEDAGGINWYNVEESSPNVFPAESNAGWIKQTITVSGTDTTFVAEDVSFNVSHLTGNSEVGFRIVFYVSPGFIESGYNADGVLIDDFELIKSNPTAEFKSISSEILFSGGEVQFEYLSTGASTYLWDFGDGTTSGLENPSHIYPDGGLYDVTLSITSLDGPASLTKLGFVRVVSQKSVPYLLADGGDLESSNGDFLISNISGTGFELGSSTISGKAGTASGANAFVTGINDAEYLNRSEAYIYMPQFDFSILGNYELSFKANYQFEEGWDGFNIEYSLDNGATWLQLNPVAEEGWYDQIAVNNSDGFWSETPIFTGSTSNAYETKTTDVTFLTGEGYVAFRLKFLSDAAAIDVGMAVDDFEMEGPEAGPAVVDFTFEGGGCSGDEVVFTNTSTGTIEALDWDFGPGATPATAVGLGPHTVVFESTSLVTNTIKLTATSSVSGTVLTENTLTTSPEIVLDPFAITVVSGETILVAPEGDGYQWLIDGNPIDGATSQNLTVTEFKRDYSVMVLHEGCFSVSGEQTVVAGIDDNFKQFGIRVFPNPAKSSVNITIDHQTWDHLTIQMYDYSGKKIFNHTIGKGVGSFQTQIDLSGQKAGLYHIELVIDGNRLTKKILIE